ncbi:MAG: serine/threonine-protein kinase [Terriglobales bacterium]
MNEAAPSRIGDYEILEVLGAGGMGQVFKVRNVISDRIEAMKILLPDLAGRQDLADRFLQEIKVLAALNHPNIAALRTALTLGNQLVMVMEFVEGMTLAKRLEAGPIAPAEALNYVDQILSALSYAHRQQVIHRDIKPANMMLTPNNVVKLMDFGIARSGKDRALTVTGTTLGSLYYMPPEQVMGGTTDARSDLYSLGVSLYEMVTGQCPFRADSDYTLMAAHVQQPPKPPIELRSDLPAALNEIILLAMAKDPNQRFQSADAFRNALSSVRGELARTGAATPAASPFAATALLQGRAAPPPPMNDLPTVSAQVPVPTELPKTVTNLPPAPPPVAAQQRTHRGLYVTLGALLVLAALVVAGIYVPRRSQTRANDERAAATQRAAATNPSDSSKSTPSLAPDGANGTQTANSTTTSSSSSMPPTSDSSSSSSEGSAPESTTNAGNPSTPATTAGAPSPNLPAEAKASGKDSTKSTATKTTTGGSGSAGSSVPRGDQGTPTDSSNSAQGQAAAEQAERLEQLEKEVDQLSSRASAVNDSLDGLRRQQASQGLGLRGDIASTQELLKTHMQKAQLALQNQDAKKAKKYLDMAEPEVEKLEKFLGR